MNQTAPEPWSDLPILNRQGTLDRLKGDDDFLTTLYRVFVGDLPKKLSAIDAAMEQGDLNGLQRSAHSLKGASATVGAEALREAAFSLEVAAKDGVLDRAGAIVPRLKDLASTTETQIQESI